MRIQTRMGCFESNSSSMHSIVKSRTTGVYTSDELYDGVYIDKKGRWHLWDDDLIFERSPYSILCTFSDKVKYAFASLAGIYLNDEEADKAFDEIKTIIYKYLPTCTEVMFNKGTKREYVDDKDGKIYNWIEDKKWDDEEDLDNWGCTGKVPVDTDESIHHFIVREYEYYKTGYVDHQSSELLSNFLRVNNISLEEFLTHREYWVVIDGDEYCEFEKQCKHKIININNIDTIFPDRGELNGEEKE